MLQLMYMCAGLEEGDTVHVDVWLRGAQLVLGPGVRVDNLTLLLFKKLGCMSGDPA